MSKGSMFWSKARGKVGDIVLSQVKGQTITRAYQSTVANPRSDKQMKQRIPFANAVKFYKYATQNLFKFAFEDKKQTESDYNAFMRYNAKNFGLVTKDAYDNPWMVPIGLNGTIYASAGRLGAVNLECLDTPETFDTDPSKWIFSGMPDTLRANSNWGEVSTAIINHYGLLDGDYITLAHIFTQMTSLEPFDLPEPPKWTLRQFRLDSSSTAETPEVFNITQGGQLQMLFIDSSSSAQYLAVIFSRVQPGGTWVSTSQFHGNGIMLSLSLQQKTESYRNQALASWNVGQSAILQGSIVEELAEEVSLEGFKGADSDEDDAFDLMLTPVGSYLDGIYIDSDANFNVWIKGEKLYALSDSDFSADDEIVQDIVLVTPETEHKGYRLLLITTGPTSTSGNVVTFLYKGKAIFKMIGA